MADITVKTKLLNSNSNDFTKAILYESVNEMVKAAQSEIQKAVKGHVCETHRNSSRGTITITANKSKPHIKYQKSNFCCNEFMESVEMNN